MIRKQTEGIDRTQIERRFLIFLYKNFLLIFDDFSYFPAAPLFFKNG